MAKLSQINRNKKREKMVAQYAARRAALKAKAEDMKVPRRRTLRRAPEACEAAAQFVQDAHPSSLRAVGPLQGLLPQGQAVAYRAARSCEFRPDPWHDQGELVRRNGNMAITDPIGDLLTRIRNGQLARHGEDQVAQFAAARYGCSTCCRQKGFIRGYAEVEFKDRSARTRDRAEISRRPARHPRTEARVDARAAAFMPRSRN